MSVAMTQELHSRLSSMEADRLRNQKMKTYQVQNHGDLNSPSIVKIDGHTLQMHRDCSCFQ